MLEKMKKIHNCPGQKKIEKGPCEKFWGNFRPIFD